MNAPKNPKSPDRPQHPVEPEPETDPDAPRAMTPDELERAGYPRNFHELTGPEKRAAIELVNAKLDASAIGEPSRPPLTDETEPEDLDRVKIGDTPLQYQEAYRRASTRLFSAATSAPPSDEQRKRVAVLQESAIELGTLIEFFVPEGRNKSLALTALEDVQMRANRGIFSSDTSGPALVDLPDWAEVVTPNAVDPEAAEGA